MNFDEFESAMVPWREERTSVFPGLILSKKQFEEKGSLLPPRSSFTRAGGPNALATPLLWHSWRERAGRIIFCSTRVVVMKVMLVYIWWESELFKNCAYAILET